MDRFGNADLLWLLAPPDNVIWAKVVKRKFLVVLKRTGAKAEQHVSREAKICCLWLRCPIGWLL